MLSITQAAEWLNIGTTTLKRLVAKGLIPAVSVSHCWKFKEVDLENFNSNSEELKTLRIRQKQNIPIKKGQKFGRLTVTEKTTVSGKLGYKCTCDCGVENKSVTSTRLKRGVITKCSNKCSIDSGQSIFNMIYEDYRRSPRTRSKKVEFSIPKEVFKKLITQNCYYCGVSPNTKRIVKRLNGGEFTYNGLDRIDSSKGYTENNIVTCCQTCNRMKLELSEQHFKAHIQLIYTNVKNSQNKKILPEDKSKDSIANLLLRVYKKTAKRKNIKFDLTKNMTFTLFQGYCHYCGKPPSTRKVIERLKGREYTYNGIDRVDNSKGYIENNVVSCCSICNYMKYTLDVEEFKQHIEQIYSHMHLAVPNCL